MKKGAVAMAFAGVMFVLYPAVRPWNEDYASTAWVAAHLFAMLGFIAVALSVLTMRNTAAVVTTWVGAGLTLPYYGAETYGLHGAARAGAADLATIADQVRYSPVAATTFALGMLLLGAGAILTAVAVGRSAWLFAIGFALFIPQFWLPAGARIAHGVLLGAGCVWLALSMWRTDGDRRRIAWDDRVAAKPV